jgi:hypothetical protein
MNAGILSTLANHSNRTGIAVGVRRTAVKVQVLEVTVRMTMLTKVLDMLTGTSVTTGETGKGDEKLMDMALLVLKDDAATTTRPRRDSVVLTVLGAPVTRRYNRN